MRVGQWVLIAARQGEDPAEAPRGTPSKSSDAECSAAPKQQRSEPGNRFGFLFVQKPQAMLVEESSTSVESEKKEPPFAILEAGNNRTKSKRRFIQMDEKSLSHTKWNCKYHIVLVPKYRRKVIYKKLRKDIGKILRTLCDYKHVEIIEAHAMPDHIHMLVSIPPKLAVADFVGYLKGKSTLMIFERHANMKYKYGRRVFWSKGYYVNTVGGNEAAIKRYIQDQEMDDQMSDQLSFKEYEDPFRNVADFDDDDSPQIPTDSRISK